MSFGHRYILSGLLKSFLPEMLETEDGETQALIAIDKLDKIGPEKVADMKIDGATEKGATELMSFISQDVDSQEDIFTRVSSLFENNEKAKEARFVVVK